MVLYEKCLNLNNLIIIQKIKETSMQVILIHFRTSCDDFFIRGKLFSALFEGFIYIRFIYINIR